MKSLYLAWVAVAFPACEKCIKSVLIEAFGELFYCPV
jgi:hypothetical protein